MRGVEIDIVITDSLITLELYESIFETERAEVTAYDKGLNQNKRKPRGDTPPLGFQKHVHAEACGVVPVIIGINNTIELYAMLLL